jgi:hypothetical protein
VAPIFERSRIESWTEFCVHFAHGFTLVRATVGATGRLETLNEFLAAAENIEPLPADIVEEIVQLHYRWSNEVDRTAELWSMRGNLASGGRIVLVAICTVYFITLSFFRTNFRIRVEVLYAFFPRSRGTLSPG